MLNAKGFAQSDRLLSGEMLAMLRAVLTALFCLTSFVGSLSAQDWAEKMFNKREHNFGTVARGADTVYRFEITNLYKQPMHITGVRSSCGCTTPTIENPKINTYEKAYIVAKFNTRTFTGYHGATLTVSLGAPYRAEVQVRVHGNIRGDVVFSPGAVQFGDIDEGSAPERTLTVTYAGRNSWRIVDVTNDNDQFEVELNELTRSSRKVSYNLLVRLKDDVPAGFIKDQITVVTNDPRADSQRIPLFIEGKVVPEISVTPEKLVLGDVATGATVTKRVVVRGKNPFRILDVVCEDDSFTFKKQDEPKTLHLLEITFRPNASIGETRVPIQVLTDRGNKRGTAIEVTANVLQPPEAETTQVESKSEQGSKEKEVQVAGGASN